MQKWNSPTMFFAGVVLSAVITGTFILINNRLMPGPEAPPAGGGQRQSEAPAPPADPEERGVPVVTMASRSMSFEDRVQITGAVAARRFSLVPARVGGILDAIFVDEGDWVEAGRTPLFQTDKVQLEQALAIARQDVSVAASAVQAREATVRRIQADLDKATIDYERHRRLYENDRAVTQSALEAQESQYRQTQAALDEARAAVALARSQQEQAEGARIIAEKNLADSLVLAPLSGAVSVRYREPGEMADRGAPVARIDDLSAVEITAFLAEQHYDRVATSDTLMRVAVSGREIGVFPVDYKSPTIDNRLRNFEVKAYLDAPPAGVVPGAMARADVIIDQRQSVGVPTASLLSREGGQVVFVVSGAQVRMVPVETGLRNDGWTEIVSGAITGGDKVVVMGQSQVNDGAAIRILEERSAD